METVWCQDEVFSRQQLTQALRKLTERVTELEDKEKQAGEVLQRRQDGSVDFNRNWTDYENGFGDLNGEFWLGLSNMHRLTSSKNYSLRVKLTDRNNIKAYALYDTFYIDGPDQYYTLHVAGYSGTAALICIRMLARFSD
nr:hypothetical protein BaRGS_030064 [Batillaria attramentaria]